ncbi:GPI ethanolamine phosphate transferase 2 [Boleophthalmus pectinirostris]|uniref:GPI ethanolamine phosphate transferase 2 n=1 Tax=Boleophthalmus pectinirostris TaxID=150288 RepID=UPI00242F48F1|nr:GPI ethanolamine phosphate transferase 2 [Boleophthalmus pectinirostris]
MNNSHSVLVQVQSWFSPGPVLVQSWSSPGPVLVQSWFRCVLVLQQTEGALPYLLVLCGDHGMSESGGHGGSSDPEVNTALLLLSPAFRRKEGMQRPLEVEQVDLAPSLALGLGLPVPQNSVGRVLPQILEGLSLRDQLRLLHLNGHQLNRLLRDSLPEHQRESGWEQFRVAERAHGSWVSLYLEGNTSEVLQNVGQKVLKQYLQALASMSAALSRQLGRYDMYAMTAGLSLALQLVLLLVLSMPECLSGAALVDVPVASSVASLPFLLVCVLLGGVHVWVCTSAHGGCFLCSLPWSLSFCVIGLMGALCCMTGALLVRRLPFGPFVSHPLPPLPSSSSSSFSELDLLLVCGTLGHALLLGSSSFVEEEHQIWYFLLNTLCLALFQDVCRRYFRERPHPPDTQTGLRLDSDWTQTGLKLDSNWTQTGLRLDSDWTGLEQLKGTVEARFVFVFVLGVLFSGTKDLLGSQFRPSPGLRRRGLWEVYAGLVLVAALLLRPHNLPVLCGSLLVQTLLTRFVWRPLKYDAAQVTIMHYWFGQAAFYHQI